MPLEVNDVTLKVAKLGPPLNFVLATPLVLAVLSDTNFIIIPNKQLYEIFYKGISLVELINIFIHQSLENP